VKPSKARVCPRCKHLNSPLAEYCGRCGMVLDEKVAQKLIEREKKIDWVLKKMERWEQLDK